MSRKKWLTLAAGLFTCICIIAIGSVAVLIFRPSLLNPFMPTYEYEITPSAYEGYSHHTLTRGSLTYESDYTEYGLSTGGNDHQIGQTPMGGRLIEISGQPDYVVLFDFMSPIAVFRKSGTPPFNWRTIDFNEMHLYQIGVAGTAPLTSTDANLIRETLEPLREGNSITASDQVDAGYQSYYLNLYSDQLQGMWYIIGVYKDTNGEVYVAENTFSKEWFPASKTFSDWVK